MEDYKSLLYFNFEVDIEFIFYLVFKLIVTYILGTRFAVKGGIVCRHSHFKNKKWIFTKAFLV